MFDALYSRLEWLLGLNLEGSKLGFSQMAGRSLVVFLFAVFLSRIADRRFLGHNAGFDIMLGVILGSVLSRAINGSAAFFPTLGASAMLILFHHVLSTASYRWKWFSRLAKGKPRILVHAGALRRDELRRCKITDDDLEETLRLNGGEVTPANIVEARLEQNGKVSVVKQPEGKRHKQAE